MQKSSYLPDVNAFFLNGEWAVRHNDWKLVVIKDEFHLSNIEIEPKELINGLYAHEKSQKSKPCVT